MTVEEAQAALDAAQTELDNATASGTIAQRVAASKRLVEARKQLTAAKRVQIEEQRAAQAKGTDTSKLTSAVQPDGTILGPDVMNESGGNRVEYQDISQATPEAIGAMRAVFGYNTQTGKTYTPAESAAASGGYLPEGYKDLVGYKFDPETKQLWVLNKQGVASGSGASFQKSSSGYIVPDLPSDWGAFRYDDQGRPINAQGQIITDEDVRRYNELVSYDPAAAKKFAQGKGITGSAVTNGRPITGSASTGVTSTGTTSASAGNYASFVSGAGMTPSGQLQNPYAPGSDAFKAFGERQSAYDLLYQQMAQYGLGSLVEPLKNLVLEGVSPSEFTLRLRESEPYKRRFAANQQRIAKGLSALSEAQYIALEDQYQNVMRNYGLPQSYYAKGDLGIQPGFEKFIAGDVSPTELEDRIQTAQNRIQYANPEVGIALKTFYPDISNGDVLGYILDPQNGLANIKRRISAAEIGGTAVAMGLATNVTDAEYLARYGVTKQQAQQGYQTIGGGLQRGSELASIYSQSPYTQATAEQEVFGVPGAVEASKKRKELIGLERATFGGQTGAGGALARERAGGF